MTAQTAGNGRPAGAEDLILDVRNLKMYFPINAGFILQRRVGDIKAVDDVSFFVRRGETLGLVGESGSGKTTIGRCVLQLEKPTAGEVMFEGTDVTKVGREELRGLRRRMQIIFQDPYSSLNPRMKVLDIVGEALTIHSLVRNKREYRMRVGDLLQQVGLNPEMANRYPHEFSGGQRQRIGVARALAVQPEFIVADEPVSALDVSIQAQLINLLKDLQQDLGLSYLMIAHDLAIVRHVSDRIAVMYLGKLMEVASWTNLYENPLHPYTTALLSAVPIPDPDIESGRDRIILQGGIPSPANPPSGCVFHTRCPIAVEECKHTVPQLREVSPDHWAACIRV
ncbi:MAG: ABC transporter ATP-binding protein [Chloroflexota bacterium]|nr:ABC transporter ATP-binding protein [Chloroflexota bacterium]